MIRFWLASPALPLFLALLFGLPLAIGVSAIL